MPTSPAARVLVATAAGAAAAARIDAQRTTHAATRLMPPPTTDSAATCSPRTITPSSSATTGIRNAAPRRGHAETAGRHRHDHVGNARAETAEREHRQHGARRPVGVQRAGTPRGAVSTSATPSARQRTGRAPLRC